MSKLLYIFLATYLCLTAQAATADKMRLADDAYRNADYHKAAALYRQQLTDGVSATVYYNLGNAYYRTDRIAEALLCYEKAKKMSPMDKDIQHNIDIARARTIDRMPAETEMFFVGWYGYVQSLMTIDGWAQFAFVSLVVALVLFLCFLFLNGIFVRRLAFYGSVVLLLFFIAGNVFAWQRKATLASHDAAIVMTETASVKTSPTLKATETCVIHEGTKVRITDSDMKDWLGIRLSDGREGWILSKEVEKI